MALIAAHEDPDSYLERPAAKFDVAETQDSPGSGSNLSDSSSHHGRFLPGTKVADRYRIVSLLGRGGMGEVYRADDLRLAQTVALKFLPPELATDAKRLEYFHNEVRLARQISHPNICRVYDIGEIDGQHFISMEYIDGEDLKALLHRIGRLPQDKGTQIVQQLCSGLHAAHRLGVLHRDLKPANIMIDGQGHARITDFGLATMSADGDSVAGMSGTPAYMAPEQMLRGETSVQSDIYSLGLISFELFTGQSAHDASSYAELVSRHESSPEAKDPSDIVHELDPAISTAIRECLAPTPEERPKSTFDLAKSLPGGDPLAAALAAGETPSPSAVAESGGSGVISVGIGVVLVCGIIAALGFHFALNGMTPAGFKKSPDRLVPIAEQILVDAGLGKVGFENAAYGFRFDLDQAEKSVAEEYRSEFWYRRSPEPIIPLNPSSLGRRNARVVTLHNPPPMLGGMVSLRLSVEGKLRELCYVEKRGADPGDSPLLPETWNQLFEHARLDFSEFQEAEPEWTGLVSAERKRAWTNGELRVEAASNAGRVVFFQVIWPNVTSRAWTLDRMDGESTWGPFAVAYETAPGLTPNSSAAFCAIWFGAVFFAALFAVRNYRRKTSDLAGSMRLAIAASSARLIAMILEANHASSPMVELSLLHHALAQSLLVGAGTGTIYAGIEPALRRHLPHTMISWNRLLAGRLNDPMVARDLLIGGCSATWLLFLPRFTVHESYTAHGIVDYGVRRVIAWIPGSIDWGITTSLFVIGILLLATLVTRRMLAGAALLMLLMVSGYLAGGESTLAVVNTVSSAVMLTLAVRYGLVSILAYGATVQLISRTPIDHDLSVWYAESGLMIYGLYIGTAIWLGYVAVSGSLGAGNPSIRRGSLA